MEFIEAFDEIYPNEIKKGIKYSDFEHYSRTGSFGYDSVDLPKKLYFAYLSVGDSLFANLDSNPECQQYWVNLLGEYKSFNVNSFDSYRIEYIIRRIYHHHLNNDSLKIKYYCRLLSNNFRQIDSADAYNATAVRLRGVYIPKDYSEAVAILDTMLSEKEKEKMRNNTFAEYMGISHFGPAGGIRNMWHLWANSRLYVFFKENTKHDNADNISGVIIGGVYLKVNDRPYEFEDALEAYDQYVEDFHRKYDKYMQKE
jgi:hypothetical protein